METAHLTVIDGPSIRINFAGSPKIKVSFVGGGAVTLKSQAGPVIRLTTQAPAVLKFNIGKNLTLFDTSFSNLTGKPEDNLALIAYLNTLDGVSAWSDLTGKPFESLSDDFLVGIDGKLKLKNSGPSVSAWSDITGKPFSSLSNLFSVSSEGLLTLTNAYAPVSHTHPYRPDTWTPTWAEISEKPEWVNRMSWDGVATVISSDVHITGKLVVDGTVQFFGAGATGGGGTGGASALWELTDVADDMVNSIYGDLPMYNGTHFARYNISNFAIVGHGHTIAQVTGLQGSLDGKQSLLGYTPYYSANFVAGVNYSAPHSHPYLSDSDARIANWSTAFGWGNHAGLYRPIGYVPSWGEITSKPTWTEKFGWDGAAVTLSTDMHITGKLVVDGTIQFFGTGATGGGGGGSTTLWGLSDVSDDVGNAVYGDLIMYNGTHFARINQSALAPAIHTHAISQVNGLQTALDGKQASGTYVLTGDGRLSDSRIASDVYAWAKASTKPSYTKAELGLSFVDNTADANKSVSYAGNAGYLGGIIASSYWNNANFNPANGQTAFGWGNHAGLYRLIGYVPSWAEVTSKPAWTDKMGWDGTAVTVSTDLHVTGKLIVDGTIQFYGAGAGGTGGGGSTTLWGLSDVADDVANAVYGDLIMYNGTHFARINQSVLAPAVHTHTISQVNGLQGALDGKQASGTYVLTGDGRLSDSRIASDVYAWAKASTKPSYTKAELGLSFVDNTADANKSVSYAGNAGYLGGIIASSYWNNANFNPASYLLLTGGDLTGRITQYFTDSGSNPDMDAYYSAYSSPNSCYNLHALRYGTV